MYTYPSLIVKSPVFVLITLEVVQLSEYTYKVCLVNSRCLCAITRTVETIVRVYLPNRLVNSSCCLYETTLKVEVIILVYLISSPNQLALFVRDNSNR